MTGRQRGPAPVTSLPFTPVLLRPLPHTVTPFANETLDSYRRRLAAANQTEFRTMRNPSRRLQCPLNELERLELISGQSRTTLLWALPELRRHAPDIVPPPEIFVVNHRAACDLCAWPSGSNGQTIQVYIRGFHDNVCIRHRRWLSYGHVNESQQLDLSQAPEIVQAQLLLDQLEQLERRIAHITGETQTEFTQVFPLERHPRGITIPWLRQGLGVLVEAVAKCLTPTEPDESEPSRSIRRMAPQSFMRVGDHPDAAVT
ncbi:hypothetical protein ACIOKD_37695 [Streptomyces sp. NPDC087844]|uniref:hypothetical protein n=1 Tax=Streptomyces sp. NPDC087844 TaxID=3365805 RepID=UPI0038197D6A